ncbi:hypothetical protein PV328_006943 [Microctonus aethiopoides]|uniref:RING-type E3 ubiquitin transferase n=1 Tax=Microctonus aethiopoides TaxID=144406 RepID=A0AA39KTX4_9HYME|nr:hypothetical protein PV328_006943 [Microctonus aethiopoides]
MATRRPIRSVLKEANQAEILRAHQRDDEFVTGLKEKLLDLLQRFGGYRSLLPYVQTGVPFKLLYFIFTSAFGNQTLGEEYTGIVQADLDARKVPSLTARVLGVILEVFGEQGLINLLERLRKSINNDKNGMKPEAVIFFNAALNKFKIAIPIVILFHKSLFYMYGHYYSLGRRVAGVNYAKVYGKRPTDGVSWGLKLLGIATLAQCALRFWQCDTIDDTNIMPLAIYDDNSIKCQLCFEAKSTTVTPCGHLFCWNCLGDWVRVRPQCPYCRERVTPSRIVHLMNL